VRISVVVPVLEEAAALSVLIESLADRTDIDELIVVDASRSREVLDIYAEPGGAPQRLAAAGGRLVGSPVASRALQMNIGGDVASGDVIVFLHADTRLPAVDLRRALAPSLPAPGWGRFDVRLDADAWWAALIGGAMNLRSRLTGIATGDQCIFVSRPLWRRLGGYRDIALMEDIEICRRLKRIARPHCVRDPAVTSARRWRRHGVLRTVLTMWVLRFRYWLGTDPARLARMYRDAR